MTEGERVRGRLARWELALYGVLLAYFAARIVFFALGIHPFVPPDEGTHVGRCLAYARVLGIPANGPTTYEYGLVDHRPWLYYWLMGRILDLNVFPISNLVLLRLANGFLGVGTALIGILWMREWCANPTARALFAVLITNTLMFTGLSGAVNYDNLANLLGAAAILLFTRFRIRGGARALLGFALVLLAGCLAKRSFLPLAFLLVALLVFRERQQLTALPAGVRALLVRPSLATLALCVGVLMLGGSVVALYGGNLLEYGRLSPGLEQVVGERDAMTSRIYARDRILERFRSGEIDYRAAREMAQQIRHMGDRNDTLFLLQAARLPESSLEGPVAYASTWWVRMMRGAVSYSGHRRATRSDAAVVGYSAIFAVAGVLLIRRRRLPEAGGIPADAVFLAAGYALVLMWLVNYPSYLGSKSIELGVQGRYIFPVLLAVHGALAYYLIESLPPRARPWMVAAVAGFYIYGDLPWFLGHVDARWFMPEI